MNKSRKLILGFLERKTLSTLFILLAFGSVCQEMVTISGYVKDETSNEVILFAKVVIPELKTGVETNEYGFFSIEVPRKESYMIKFVSQEHPPFQQVISAMKSQIIEVELPKDKEQQVKEVTVRARRSEGEENVKNTEVSVIRLDIKKAKMLPALGGETDVIKVAQLLPGINRGVEGGTDFFVRGGDGDQNLILVDEATVYNPGHLFGFFSVFNPDVIKEMTLYKGGFPANYGGRLSSVTDIRMIDGDKKKIHGEGGIGLLSSRLTLQAPIIKEKMSIMLSGRRTYIDHVFKMVGQNLPYFFYDLNGKIHYKIGAKDQIMVSSYFGNDVLSVNSDATDSTDLFGFGFKLGNFTQTARWTHIFGQKLFSNLSLIHSRFKYDIGGKFGLNNVVIKSAIRDFSMKYDFTYFKSKSTKIKFGVHGINHNFRPNVISTAGDISDFLSSREGDLIATGEAAIYANIFHEFNEKWKLDGGLRLSSGFLKGKFYGGIEPRVNTTRILNEQMSLKGSYSRMTQYMHRVSSSSVALPTDLWYPATQNVRPQIADQIAASYNVFFPKLKSSLIIEGYYKYMQNLTEYKEGSNIILNDNFEDLLLQGNGWSTGAEFLLRKEEGRLTGWIGYTISWTKRKFDELNGGEAFWAKYDRRHYLTAVGIFDISPRVSFSAIFELATGARFTPIVGQYLQPNAGLSSIDVINIYAERNSYKMSTSHRLDVNFVFKSKPEKTKFAWEWHLGGYNVYHRATPFRITVVQDQDTGKLKYSQPGLFGFIPSVAFNFKF
ncbi:MAG: TonB-dependent receptor [Crocinitomicaceae bacterium]|nr:TonB-dependent receptor [Crocinitomicaceae bacterium]